jgi:hypothetical protein
LGFLSIVEVLNFRILWVRPTFGTLRVQKRMYGQATSVPKFTHCRRTRCDSLHWQIPYKFKTIMTSSSDHLIKAEPEQEMNGIQTVHHPALSATSLVPEDVVAISSAPVATTTTNTTAIASVPGPSRKDRNLRGFLDMMDDYAPIVITCTNLTPFVSITNYN